MLDATRQHVRGGQLYASLEHNLDTVVLFVPEDFIAI
jgi:hypothetical protein